MPVLPTYPVSNPFVVNKTAHGRHLHTVEVAGSNPTVSPRFYKGLAANEFGTNVAFEAGQCCVFSLPPCEGIEVIIRYLLCRSPIFDVPWWTWRHSHFRLRFSAVSRSCSSINSSIRLALYLRVPSPNRMTGRRGYLREEWSQTQSLLTFSL